MQCPGFSVAEMKDFDINKVISADEKVGFENGLENPNFENSDFFRRRHAQETKNARVIVLEHSPRVLVVGAMKGNRPCGFQTTSLLYRAKLSLSSEAFEKSRTGLTDEI